MKYRTVRLSTETYNVHWEHQIARFECCLKCVRDGHGVSEMDSNKLRKQIEKWMKRTDTQPAHIFYIYIQMRLNRCQAGRPLQVDGMCFCASAYICVDTQTHTHTPCLEIHLCVAYP